MSSARQHADKAKPETTTPAPETTTAAPDIGDLPAFLDRRAEAT